MNLSQFLYFSLKKVYFLAHSFRSESIKFKQLINAYHSYNKLVLTSFLQKEKRNENLKF